MNHRGGKVRQMENGVEGKGQRRDKHGIKTYLRDKLQTQLMRKEKLGLEGEFILSRGHVTVHVLYLK